MSYRRTTGPMAIAHRGGMGLAPENTLAAFSRATALGLRYLETDVRRDADGGLWCFHDESVDRVAGGLRGRVSRLGSAQLSRVRVGGEPLVTLADALSAFPDSCFAVDVKDESAIEPLVRVLRATGVAERVCVAGAWDGWLDAVRAAVPGVSTALGWRRLSALIAAGRTGARLRGGVGGASFAHVAVRLGRFPVFAERLVGLAHGAGLRVVVWTVNDPVLMGSLLDCGVDGIITDRPDVVREKLIQRGEWGPTGPLSAQPASRPGVSSRPCPVPLGERLVRAAEVAHQASTS